MLSLYDFCRHKQYIPWMAVFFVISELHIGFDRELELGPTDLMDGSCPLLISLLTILILTHLGTLPSSAALSENAFLWLHCTVVSPFTNNLAVVFVRESNYLFSTNNFNQPGVLWVAWSIHPSFGKITLQNSLCVKNCTRAKGWESIKQTIMNRWLVSVK